MPKSAPVQQYLGMLLASTGNRPEARQAFQSAKAADPTFVAADLASAQIDLVESHYDAAKLTLSNIIHANERNVDARLLLGMAEEASGNFTRAIDEYRKVVVAEPSNSVALNNLSYRLANSRQADEAIKYAEQAFEQNPNNLAFEDTLGWAYYQKGVYPSAIRHLANGAKSNVAVRNYHLAMAYAKAGNKQKAREAYQVAQKLNPNLPEAKEAAELVR
jgi:tetratricopeptide (TPR) repeat protein